MARAFTSAASATIIAGAAPVTAVPLTLACWFKANDITNNHTPLGLFKQGGAGAGAEAFYLSASGGIAGDFLMAITATNADTYAIASSSIAYTANVWQHACGVFATNNSRVAYLDGGNSGSETTSVTPSGIDRVYLGAFHNSTGTLYSECSVADAGIWNVALSVEEIASLARGFSPLLVRPASLVAYFPLIGRYSPEIELRAGNSGTVTGATQVDHPRVIYPGAPYLVEAPPAPTNIGDIFNSSIFDSSVFRRAA
jgi:hypothetical protein